MEDDANKCFAYWKAHHFLLLEKKLKCASGSCCCHTSHSGTRINPTSRAPQLGMFSRTFHCYQMDTPVPSSDFTDLCLLHDMVSNFPRLIKTFCARSLTAIEPFPLFRCDEKVSTTLVRNSLILSDKRRKEAANSLHFLRFFSCLVIYTVLKSVRGCVKV